MRARWTTSRLRAFAATLALIVASVGTWGSSPLRTEASAFEVPIVVGRLGIITMDPQTGKTIQRLVGDEPSVPRNPLRSPDGSKVLFATRYENRLEINVIGIDGSNRMRLTDNQVLDQWPSWAPDSERFAVERWNADTDGDSDIFLVRVDGSGERPLVSSSEDEQCPSWSPDGERIAFSRGPGPNILTVQPNGRRLRQLTFGPGRDGSPLWAPDGSKILFRRVIVNGSLFRSDIYVMNGDGSNVKQLTDSEADERVFSWAPDGSKIAFLSAAPTGPVDLWVMNRDGTNEHRVAKSVGSESGTRPSWSPSSTRIIYARPTTSGDESKVDVWSVRSDGSNNHVLVNSFGDEDAPMWYSSPQSCLVAY